MCSCSIYCEIRAINQAGCKPLILMAKDENEIEASVTFFVVSQRFLCFSYAGVGRGSDQVLKPFIVNGKGEARTNAIRRRGL